MNRSVLFTLWICVGIFLPGIILAQYQSETVTEKSFEQSEQFFRSYFLNPFGLPRFEAVAVGLIDDPFLNLYLNPARAPRLEQRSTHFYLDFRGDRTEAPVINHYLYRVAAYEDLAISSPSFIPPDPRWYANTRNEPEPVFSLGVLAYPFGANHKFWAGGTYQLTHKKDPFYTLPNWIYYGRFGYDAFNNPAVENSRIPIVDRFSGRDEMMIESHFFSGFLGYRLTPALGVGASLNGVALSREGQYLNASQSGYGNNDTWRYRNFFSRDREQTYDHLDMSGGLHWRISPAVQGGLKIGYLQGLAEQSYRSSDSSFYQYRQPGQGEEWSLNRYRSDTRQSWEHDGSTWYGRVSLSGAVAPDIQIGGYYHFAKTDLDLVNASTIQDTGYYDSRWSWSEGQFYQSWYRSSLFDDRSGRGSREQTRHQALFNLEWRLTPRNTVIGGVYYSRDRASIDTREPVNAGRYSESFYIDSQYQPEPVEYLNRLIEDKTLNWRYRSTFWTLQVPILTRFQLNDHWSVLLGVNRILNSWTIEEETLALFDRRERNEGGQVTVDTNFGERYRQPDRTFTEDFTDVIANVEVALTSQFRINLLLDPAFEEEFRIAQWWLGFRTGF